MVPGGPKPTRVSHRKATGERYGASDRFECARQWAFTSSDGA